MCGICGVYNLSDQRAVPAAQLEAMTDSIAHRGPDAAGFHFEPGVGLGHRRLSIIDLKSGDQPMTNEDESIWIIFNGEIYNFPELREQLLRKGHTFKTKSDTETIIHLYEEVGESCFTQLRGMFAVALWDRKSKKLVLARDRVGKKPLYYYAEKGRFIFGSEIKAVLAAGNVSTEIDPEAIVDYFTFTYIPAPKSIYKRIRKLRAAHYMVVTPEGIRENPYWDVSFSNVRDQGEDQWIAELNEVFFDSVSGRLMSEVPLGSFLSGGTDSSAVVAAMARLLSRPVITCSVGFEEQKYNELKYARLMANKVGAEAHETTVRADAASIVKKLSWHYDEPFGDSSAVPTYYVSKATREHVTVALSGDGGDENFAGYHRYRHQYQDNRLRQIFPAVLRRSVFKPLGDFYPRLERAPRIFRAKSTFKHIGMDPLEGYLAEICTSPEVMNRLFTDEFRASVNGYDPTEQFRDIYERADTNDLISRLQYLDIKTYLTDDICVKVDRASMAVSLEVRCPLLDHRLIELAAHIPSSLKLKNGTGKYIFMRAVAGMVPAEVMYRRKQGFGVPVAEWFRQDLKASAYEALFNCSDDMLNLHFLRDIWDRHQSGIQDHSALLWSVFMLRQWQSEFGRPGTGFFGSQPASVAGQGL